MFVGRPILTIKWPFMCTFDMDPPTWSAKFEGFSRLHRSNNSPIVEASVSWTTLVGFKLREPRGNFHHLQHFPIPSPHGVQAAGGLEAKLSWHPGVAAMGSREKWWTGEPQYLYQWIHKHQHKHMVLWVLLGFWPSAFLGICWAMPEVSLSKRDTGLVWDYEISIFKSH